MYKITEGKVDVVDKGKLFVSTLLPAVVFAIPMGSLPSIVVGYMMMKWTEKIREREATIDQLRSATTPVGVLPVFFNRGLLSFFKAIPLEWNEDPVSKKLRITPQQLAKILIWADADRYIFRDGKLKTRDEIVTMITSYELLYRMQEKNKLLFNKIFDPSSIATVTAPAVTSSSNNNNNNYNNNNNNNIDLCSTAEDNLFITLQEMADTFIVQLTRLYQQSKPKIMTKMNIMRSEAIIALKLQQAASIESQLIVLKKQSTSSNHDSNSMYAVYLQQQKQLEREVVELRNYIKCLSTKLSDSTKLSVTSAVSSSSSTSSLHSTASSVHSSSSSSNKFNFFHPSESKKAGREYKIQRYRFCEDFEDVLERISNILLNEHVNLSQAEIDSIRPNNNRNNGNSVYNYSYSYTEEIQKCLQKLQELMACEADSDKWWQQIKDFAQIHKNIAVIGLRRHVNIMTCSR